MPPSPRPFGRHAAFGVLASAGLGLQAGALTEPTGPFAGLLEGSLMEVLQGVPVWGATALLCGGLSAWMLARRRSRPQPVLRLQLRPLPLRQTLDGVLYFVSAAPHAWCARRGEWCLDLDGGGPVDLPWRMALRRGDQAGQGADNNTLPLAHAATLDAVLTASRRLYALARPGAACPMRREAAELLGCDLEFSLPALRQRITALAEGGYALQDESGCRAVSAPTADALIGEAGRLHAASR